MEAKDHPLRDLTVQIGIFSVACSCIHTKPWRNCNQQRRRV